MSMLLWAKTFSKILGKPFYWHALRHRFTTKLSEAGIPDEVIQNILGWADISLVSVYKDRDELADLGKYFKDGEIIAAQQGSLSSL